MTGLTPRPDWEGDTAEVEGCAELAGQATGDFSVIVPRTQGLLARENIFILAKKVKLLNQELE